MSKSEADKIVLSSSEMEILRLVIAGLNREQIAEKLTLSHEIVDAQMKRILDKLAAKG